MNYSKVPEKLKELCTQTTELLTAEKSIAKINELAFLAHYQCVTIHPFADGNGRTSRLLMNYIQAYHNLPLTIVYTQDREEYIQSLVETRQKEDVNIFIDFMKAQYLKFLQQEIAAMEKPQELKSKKAPGMNFGVNF